MNSVSARGPEGCQGEPAAATRCPTLPVVILWAIFDHRNGGETIEFFTDRADNRTVPRARRA
jgi:hypothetical protein